MTHCVVRRVNIYIEVFVQVENEKKSLPVFAAFGRPVHLKLVAKLPIQEGRGEGFANWEGCVWQERKGSRYPKLSFVGTERYERGGRGTVGVIDHHMQGMACSQRSYTLYKRVFRKEDMITNSMKRSYLDFGGHHPILYNHVSQHSHLSCPRTQF